MVALWIIAVAVVGIGIVAFASLVPLPSIGIQSFNSTVSVTAYDIPLVLGNLFGITAVSGHTTGGSTLIDWSALSIGSPGINVQYTMTVCEQPTGGGNQLCTAKSASVWFPSINLGNQLVATNSFVLGFVPPGNYNIAVTLTQNGGTVATGSGTTCVPGC